jgi:LPS-assembly lipoprotein
VTVRSASVGLAVAFLLLVAGCGFRPLHAPPPAGSTEPRRAGGFNPSGERVDARYILHVRLLTQRVESAIRRDGTATRALIDTRADYTLVDLRTGVPALSGVARSFGSHDLVENEYANIVADADFRARAVQELASEIQTRVAMFLQRDPATAAR